MVIDAYRVGVPVVFSNAKQALMSWLNTDVINRILQTLRREDASTNNREIVKTLRLAGEGNSNLYTKCLKRSATTITQMKFNDQLHVRKSNHLLP